MTKDEIAIRLSLTYAERLIEDNYKPNPEDCLMTYNCDHPMVGNIEYYLFISFDKKENCYMLNHVDSKQFISKNKQVCAYKIPLSKKNNYGLSLNERLEVNRSDYSYYSNVFTEYEINYFSTEIREYYQAEDKRLRLDLKLAEKDDKTTIKKVKI